MSLDFINELPTELLSQVFDCLFREERKNVAAVCTRWSDIISSRTYTDKLELKLYDIKREELNAFKCYQIISTQYVYGMTKDTIIRLQQFLNNEVVMMNVEELYLAFKSFMWKDLFPSNKELFYPELRKITIDGLQNDDGMSLSRCQMIAPKLKILELVSSPPIWLLSDQIETLVIANCESLVLPDADLLPNLRSLTLKNIRRVTDNDSFKPILHRLKQLQLLDVNDSIYREVFDNARNIESLSISDKAPVSNKIYTLINNMTKLKQLALLAVVKCPLSLPYLEKLTLQPLGWPSLENVPNLRYLGLKGCIPRGKDHIFQSSLYRDYYRSISHQLHHLTLTRVILIDSIVNQICTFNNLQTMKLLEVEAEFADIERILQSLSNLKLLRLESCTIAKEFVLDRYYHGVSKTLEKHFSKLTTQYPDCAVAATSTCFKEKLFPDYPDY